MEFGIHREESVTLSSQISLVSKIWGICDTSQAVKLLLPDEMEIPYYLQRSNKFSKTTAKWRNITSDSIEENLNNLKKLSPRLSPKRKVKLSSLIPILPRLKGRELRMEEALLKPYRESEEIRQALLAKYPALPIKKSPSTSPRRAVLAKMSPRESAKATFERSNLSIKANEDTIEPIRILKEPSIIESSSSLELRQILWTKIIQSLCAYNKIVQFVKSIRSIRNSDPRRWKAAILIQKNWRFHFYMRKHKSFSVHLADRQFKMWRGYFSYKERHNDRSRRNPKGALTCQLRAESCSIISKFLWDLKYGALKTKFCLRIRVKQIKTIQRQLRGHCLANAARVTLLSRHLDRMSECLHLHVSIVLSERGLDLGNLHPFDLNRLSACYRSVAPTYCGLPRALSLMETASFHSFLRKLPARALAQLQKCFVNLFGSRDVSTSPQGTMTSAPAVGGKYSFPLLEKITKRILLLDLIFKARRKHQQKLSDEAKKALVLRIPRFSVSDAREFVSLQRTDQDPLSHLLSAAMREQDRYYHSLLLSGMTKKAKKGTGPGINKITGPQGMLLLGLVGPEDLVLLLLELSELNAKQFQVMQSSQDEDEADWRSEGKSGRMHSPQSGSQYSNSGSRPNTRDRDKFATSVSMNAPATKRKEKSSNKQMRRMVREGLSDQGDEIRAASPLESTLKSAVPPALKNSSKIFVGRMGRMKQP